jgi:hypothetical protein
MATAAAATFSQRTASPESEGCKLPLSDFVVWLAGQGALERAARCLSIT